MAKCKVLVRPTGAYDGKVWPQVGETVDLPDHVAEAMARSGNVEIVKTPAKKAAEPSKAEKRPATHKAAESRPAKDR